MTDTFKDVADAADVIYDGYAFTAQGDTVRIVNLFPPHHAMLIRPDGDVLETSMDDIEIQLVLGYYARASKYMVA